MGEIFPIATNRNRKPSVLQGVFCSYFFACEIREAYFNSCDIFAVTSHKAYGTCEEKLCSW